MSRYENSRVVKRRTHHGVPINVSDVRIEDFRTRRRSRVSGHSGINFIAVPRPTLHCCHFCIVLLHCASFGKLFGDLNNIEEHGESAMDQIVGAGFSSIPFANSILTVILLSLFSIAGPAFGKAVKFEGNTNVGKCTFPGSVQLDSILGTYRVRGSGENIWDKEDAFYYVWRKCEGDLSVRTDILWEGKGKHPHRKAGWMIRAGLEKDDAYVDAVAHGDGLISMQYRRAKGEATYELQYPFRAPASLLLERTGDQFTLSVIQNDGQVHPTGTITLELQRNLYAGLVVCSHDSTVEETAVFSNVTFDQIDLVSKDQRVVESTLETINVESGFRSIVRRAKEHFEAPNWSRDGKTLYYNSGGKIFTLPVSGGSPATINTGFASKCNNDHGLSPDGNGLVISDQSKDGKSRIYVLPANGGEPRLVTELAPSYWHGWSPDGKTLAYCAERNGEFDVYTIPIEGGQEKRLTNAPGLDDSPEYSPDGQYIYFNSVRTGQMKIWRMKADGSEQTQMTPNDAYGDWFAHPSPDGKQIVFLSYAKNVEGHPANKDVVLRIMPVPQDSSTGGGVVAGGEPKILATLFGGQGTINVPSWSPDSKNIAFVSYRLVAP
jgi:TolB protein